MKPKEWKIRYDTPYEDIVIGPKTNGNVLVIEKSAYDKLKEALETIAVWDYPNQFKGDYTGQIVWAYEFAEEILESVKQGAKDEA